MSTLRAPAAGGQAGARFLPCAVVPVYDHERAIGAVAAGLRAAGLRVLLVDDGSGSACARVLDALAAADHGITLVRRVANGGKGAAVTDGLRAAQAAGHTHALQVDADGQHALADVPRFLAAGAARPDALVCGLPVFDASMPRSRYLFRYLTHALVWLETLSLEVRDSMCGYRLYPLAPVLAMIDAERPGSRMDFDIEVLVRLHWRGLPLQWLPTRVTYPADGVSHFRMLLDNALITRLHARLVFGMLWRAPRLIARRLRGATGRRMRKAGVLPVEVAAEVAFHDVDLAQVVWHGHYLKWFENARWALMARIGYTLQDMLGAGEGWPIVDLEVRYLKPARFGDALRVRASLIEWDTRLVIHYLALDAAGARVARARTVQVAIDMRSGELRYALPAAFGERVRAALAAAGEHT